MNQIRLYSIHNPEPIHMSAVFAAANFDSKFPDPGNYTPVLRQYLEQRAKTGDAILLFRLGDFYECFFHDAEVLAKELEIALTARADAAHPGGKVPMAGVPYKTADSSIAKLLKAGFKVAICEQIGDSEANGKGPMKRELTRVLTPGTLIESEYLQSEQANYLASIFPLRLKSSSNNQTWGLAFVDISTGQLKVTELSENHLLLELIRIKPVELLVSSTRVKDELGISIDHLILPEDLNKSDYTITDRPLALFDLNSAIERLKSHFGEHALEGFGCANYQAGLQALGAILDYLEFTYPDAMKSLTKIQVYEPNEFLKIDEQTARNLELFETIRTRSKKGSLLGFMEQFMTTKMGLRLLREWINAPLLNILQIEERQQALEALLLNHPLRAALKELLNEISDLERLSVKLNTGRINPRELGWIKNSLLQLPRLKALLAEIQNSQSQRLLSVDFSDSLSEKAQELHLALLEELPILSTEGGIFKSGYSSKLDGLRELVEQNESWLENYEAKERERTSIKSLKVCFNKATGFYIELTKANRSLAPEDYKIKQNLTNVDRYITAELKEQESKFIMAESSLKQTEYELFSFLRESLAGCTEEIKCISSQIAQLDCLLCFAEVSAKYQYKKPLVNESFNLNIENGRHPVIEQLMPNGHFIGNDLNLLGRDKQIQPSSNTSQGSPQMIILTGPNMSGKSTFMKQAALICLLAQIGCFVPADSAEIGIVDRVFTRIGASDDLSLGQSTFMVEMIETAYLLNNMTSRSLIILDEIGRGTSTYDGVAIAWSVAEYIAKQGARTIFATHYHELNGMADLFRQIANYQVSVNEENGELVFLHKVLPGGADKSYGIEVARMAGLPRQILNRAQGIMAQMNAKGLPSKKRSMVRESIEQAKLELDLTS